MKLIIAIVSKDDSSAVTSTLTEHGYFITKLATTGGFLKAGNTTFLIGTDDEKVPEVVELIKAESSRRTEIVPATATFDAAHYAAYPIEIQVGGATIFILNVEEFIKA